MSAIETLRDALFGNPPQPTKEPSREGVLAAFTDLYDQAVVAMHAAQAGLTTVPDIAARDAFFANAENQGKLVYVNDNNGSASDPANGVYEYVEGSARLAEGFYTGVTASVQPLVDEVKTIADEWSTYDLGENLNLFNKDDPNLHTGFTLNALTGALSANADFYTTHFMPVEGLANITRAPTAAGKVFSFYRIPDQSGFISSVTAAAGATSVAVPAGAKWMRTALRIAESPVAELMFTAGTVAPAAYSAWQGKNLNRRFDLNAADGVAALDHEGKLASDALRTGTKGDLFEPTQASYNAAIQSNSGATAASAEFFTTGFIRVRPGATYTHSPPATAKFYSFYDEDQIYIPGSQIASTGTFAAPMGAVFVRGSHRYADHDPDDYQFVEGSALPGAPLPRATRIIEVLANKNVSGGYAGLGDNGKLPNELLPEGAGTHPLAGKLLAGLGDSITYGFIPRNAPGYPGQLQSWLSLVADKLGADGVLNHGISGSTLAYHATRNPMSRRFDAISDDADVICLMGGTNDVRNGIALGAMGDTTDTTFYGALDVLAQGLLNKYRYDQGTEAGAGKLVVFMTPIRLLDADEPGGLDALLPSYCQAVKDVAEKYAIPVFDAYNDSGLTPELFRTLQGTETGYTDLYNPYVTDGTHPTQEGHEILAARVAGFIRSITT